MEEILNSYEQEIRNMAFRHPWVNLFYNWLVAGLVVALMVSFVLWGVEIHNRNVFEAGQQDAYAAIEAERAVQQEAEAEAEKLAAAEDAALQIREAQALARALWGIRNFKEKYDYSLEDLVTYMMCPKNRSEETGKSIEEVLNEPKQFIAYSTGNTLDKEFYDIALAFVADWHEGKLPECDTKFRYAVCNEYGVFLVDDPGKAVPERWHA